MDAAAQSDIGSIKQELQRAKQTSGAAKDAHIESAGFAATNAQQHVSNGSTELNAATDSFSKLWERFNDWPAKYIGWKNWEHIREILIAWGSIGALGIVSQFVGLGWLSTGIMRLLPFSNPFAFIRDRISKSFPGKEGSTTTVVVQQAPAPAPSVSVETVASAPKKKRHRRAS